MIKTKSKQDTNEIEYVVALTYLCNWNCPYCAVRNKHDWKPQVNQAERLDKMSAIPDNSIVTLMGGEVGMLDKDEIDVYFSYFKDRNFRLNLETNGLFLDRYPELRGLFNEIRYHCSMDLYPERIHRYPTLSRETYRYLLIVHDLNVKRLGDFVSLNSNLKFDIISATYPYEITGPTLSNKNKMMIMSKFIKNMTKESFLWMMNGRDYETGRVYIM